MPMGLRKALDFRWSPQKSDAALKLAEGLTKREVAELASVSEQTIYNWLNQPEFSEEVDRLSLMIGVANRAERLRIANRVIREKMRNDEIKTDKDILDWIKFAQSETDGVKLGLTETLTAAAASVAGSGSEDTD